MHIEHRAGGFDLSIDGKILIAHRPDAPCIFVGRGTERMAMFRGNFDVEDYVEARIPLCNATASQAESGWRIDLAAAPDLAPALTLAIGDDGRGKGSISFTSGDPGLNRFWLRLCAEPGEHLFGGGEQMSYLDLAGRRFPLWTSEPGVGRDKSSPITFEADRTGRAGGDYYNTNYPQPTYLSSRRYALHVETTAYSIFDFRHAGFHEIEVWEIPRRIELFSAPAMAGLVTAISSRFGRQPPLPDWAMDGAIIGLKDGTRSFDRLETFIEAGAVVSGLWCEDWVGLRETSFGQRLFWDWQASDTRYPQLKEQIASLSERGIRFLGYVNPYLCRDGALFAEAEAQGFFATSEAGSTYLVDFGEFDCGVVDFTNPAACDWFATRIIGENLIDLGLSGWMADFGEYLPIDLRLKDGSDPRLMHNAWPVKWGEVNAKAVAERGRNGDIVFFMRAGYSGIQAHCPLLWAGDQSVDFSRHDGLVTAIVGALSCGLVGNAYHHSDIGGYTSLFGHLRTAELLMRWAEMAAFTPMMRTHEGNRPTENLQIDQDQEVLAHFSRMTRLHAALKPYFAALRDEAAATGLPFQRPLFLHYEEDPRAFEVLDAYLLGTELLVAPVWQADKTSWKTYLPKGAAWRHVWTGTVLEGGTDVEVAAPFGQPPVFAREGSPFSGVFAALGEL